MKKLVTILLVSALGFTSLVASEVERGESKGDRKGKFKNMELPEAKAMIIKKLDSHILKLQTAKDCVSKAETKKGLRECKPMKGKKNRKNRGGDRG